MAVYYNEIDPFAVAWLRELIKAGQIADCGNGWTLMARRCALRFRDECEAQSMVSAARKFNKWVPV